MPAVGIVEPAPDRAGDDEGDGQRIEVDRAPDRFAAHALVDQDRQQQPDRHRADDVEAAEEEEVGVGDVPAPVLPERGVVLEADEAVARQQRGVRQRDVERPAGEHEDVDEARHERRGQHEERHRGAQPLAPRAGRARDAAGQVVI